MVTEKVLPPILKPFLYGVVCLILEITQLSGAPNPASGPVSGWIQPIVMPFVPPPALAPLMPEEHASSRPPVPATAAPAPTARSRPRRLMLPARLMPPDRTLWSLICHLSPCLAVSQAPGPHLRQPRRYHSSHRRPRSASNQCQLWVRHCGTEALLVCAWRTAMRNTTRRNAAIPFANGTSTAGLRQMEPSTDATRSPWRPADFVL